MRHLKIESLPSSDIWIDRDDVMLHSCFQILKDFIEKEKGHIACNYIHHKEFVDEINILYKWWINRINKDEDEQDDSMILRLMKIRNQLRT